MPVSPEQIGDKLGALRESRRWSQTELAERLGISQSRLSQIELGRASLTAEQLIEALRLFNVSISAFVDVEAADDRTLQNALAYYGARHLRTDPDVILDERVDLHETLVRALNTGDGRMLVAMAPVLVEHARELNFAKLSTDADRSGRRARLYWVMENTLAATRLVLLKARFTSAAKYRYAIRQLELMLGFSTGYVTDADDVVEPGLRSRQAIDRVAETASPISKKWRVISSLVPTDFADSIREAYDA